MNKSDLIEVVSAKLGDRRAASTAIEAVVDAITRAVAKGEKVGISGFGVFEPVERAERTARNPTTGEAVRLERTRVPKFRPGQGFKDIVSGAKEVDPTPGIRAVTARAGVPRRPRTTGEEAPAAPAARAAGTAAARRAAGTGRTSRAAAPAAVPVKNAPRAAAPAKTTRAAAPAAAKAAAKAPAKAKAKAAGPTAKATGRTVAAPGARSAAAAKAPGKKTTR